MTRSTKVDLLSCPFCGKEESELKVGYISTGCVGITCRCGVSLSQEYFEAYSEEAITEMDEFEANGLTWLESLYTHHLLNVCEKWNKRV